MGAEQTDDLDQDLGWEVKECSHLDVVVDKVCVENDLILRSEGGGMCGFWRRVPKSISRYLEH